MLKQQAQKRATVTIDDRRAVIVIAKFRKPAEVAKVSDENFIRNALKDRLAWPRRDPAPESVMKAAKELATSVKAMREEAAAQIKAKADAAKAAEGVAS